MDEQPPSHVGQAPPRAVAASDARANTPVRGPLAEPSRNRLLDLSLPRYHANLGLIHSVGNALLSVGARSANFGRRTSSEN
jgi:hypothetical protein